MRRPGRRVRPIGWLLRNGVAGPDDLAEWMGQEREERDRADPEAVLAVAAMAAAGAKL